MQYLFLLRYRAERACYCCGKCGMRSIIKPHFAALCYYYAMSVAKLILACAGTSTLAMSGFVSVE